MQSKLVFIFALSFWLIGCQTAPTPELSISEPTDPPLVTTATSDPQSLPSRQAKPRKTFTVPANIARGLLPPDGVIISHVERSNVWKRNTEPFFRHEMVELTLGRAIRAKEGDRRNERSLTPSVTFNQGYLTLHAGWRAHKNMGPLIDDFFDGTAVGAAYIAYVGGTTIIDASFIVDWKEFWFLRAVGNHSIEDEQTAKIEKQLKREIEKKAPRELSKQITKILAENNLPLGLTKHVLADITTDGLRFRLYDYDLIIHEVKVPNFDFRLKKTDGDDRDFGGNGPKIDLNVNIRQNGQNLFMMLGMTATETKSNWTQGKNSQEQLLYSIPDNELFVDVIGGTNIKLLKEFVMDGHEPQLIHTQFGHFRLVGDTKKDDDVPSRSGIKLVRPQKIYIVTMRKA
jgi:hypothetical protein